MKQINKTLLIILQNKIKLIRIFHMASHLFLQVLTRIKYIRPAPNDTLNFVTKAF